MFFWFWGENKEKETLLFRCPGGVKNGNEGRGKQKKQLASGEWGTQGMCLDSPQTWRQHHNVPSGASGVLDQSVGDGK